MMRLSTTTYIHILSRAYTEHSLKQNNGDNDVKIKCSTKSINDLKSANIDSAVVDCVAAIVLACGANEIHDLSVLRSTLVDALLKYQRKALLICLIAAVTVQSDTFIFLEICAFV